MKVVSPVARTLILETFQKQKILIHLGATLKQIDPGSVQIHLPKTDLTTQHHGFIHGGLVSTVADTVAGLSGYTVLQDPTHSCITVEMKINFIRPADSGILGVGKLIKANKNLIISTAEVFTDEGKLCAYMLQTLKKVIPGQ